MLEAQILRDCCDIHLHVAPSLIPRAADIVTVARQAEEAGYRAIVIKDHHCNSAPACDQVKRHLFANSGLEILGSISLNNSVGGVNPYVVEAAIGFGVRVVWMPTVSAAQHIAFHSGGNAFPGTGIRLQENPISLIDTHGSLTDRAAEVIAIIARNPQVVLATGHGCAAEVHAVVEKAVELGVKNIVVNHPTFGIGAALEQVQYWASLGCWIEHCGTISHPDMGEKRTAPTEIARWIRAVGVERTILSSDYGQLRFGNCIEGMDRYVHQLREAGFTSEELKTMCCDNPAKALSLSKK